MTLSSMELSAIIRLLYWHNETYLKLIKAITIKVDKPSCIVSSLNDSKVSEHLILVIDLTCKDVLFNSPGIRGMSMGKGNEYSILILHKL